MTDNSGGPFDTTPTEWIPWDSSWPESADIHERHFLFRYLEERFGIPQSNFDDYLLFRRKRSWSILREPPLQTAVRLKVSKVGIKAFQQVGSHVKPTTSFIQLFGHAATRAVLEIDESRLEKLLTGKALAQELDLDKGYVILRLGLWSLLGLGFYAQGRVTSQLPKKHLRSAMLRASF